VPALLQIALVNAVLAALLACVVALIARKVRRPALVHALWLVVLVKLVTPPAFEVPVPFVAANWLDSVVTADPPRSADVLLPGAQAQSSAISESAGAVDDGALVALTAGLAREAAATDEAASGARGEPSTGATFFARGRAAISTAASVAWAWLARHGGTLALWLWLCGSIVWFARQALTTLRFSRRLALATPAPEELQKQADRLARGMGLSHRPPVLIVRDVISPMLWGVGRNARLLFPVELLARLDAASRETLIAHELAHFRRADHWIRALELVISGIYWWHPVVWWARREIEISQEECCDAWVMDQFPDAPRCYAEALLETIDFLSEEPLVLPPAAAGLGQVPLLRRRLTAIMRGAAPKEMSPVQWVAVLAATMVLPLHPALGRSSPRLEFASHDAIASAQEQEPLAANWPTGTLVEELSHPLAEALLEASEPPPFPPDANRPWATAVSPEPGHRFSITRRKDTVALHDESTGESTDLTAHRILTAAFSRDGAHFVTGDDEGTVRLWASSTGEMLKAFRGGHADRIQGVAFIHGGLDLVSASRDGTIKLWNIELGSELSALSSDIRPLNCLALSPNGRWLAVGTGHWKSVDDLDGRVLVWDLATLRKYDAFKSERPIGAIAFKADSNTLLAGSLWGHVTIWDLKARSEIGTTLPDYKNAIAAAQFSTDTSALSNVGVDDIFREPPPEAPGPVFEFFPERPIPTRTIRGSLVPGSLTPGAPAPGDRFLPPSAPQLGPALRQPAAALESIATPTN
jgi:beta-lactamase regulating signal transducer with metallopeptidase domain